MSGGQATGAALRQSGRIYFAQVSPFIPNAWTSIRRLGLQATNFAEIVVANGVGTLDQNRHPDFSASGAPIELAFIRAVSITPPGVFIETSAGIDNWRVTVNYAAPCDFSLAPASQAFSAIGGSGEIRLTTSSDCPWSATSDAAWITVSSATSGVGNGQVRFTVSPNAGAPRSGAIRIEDRIFTVSQADPASSCAFGVVWNSAHHSVDSDWLSLDSRHRCELDCVPARLGNRHWKRSGEVCRNNQYGTGADRHDLSCQSKRPY
jgi:hypothetical protein